MKKYPNVLEVIGFYGYSNSGKTSLIIRLITELKEDGLLTAVIKCTDKSISSEPLEKDTSNFRAAGAKMTSFSSNNETNFVLPVSMSITQIVAKIREFMEVDIIIIEGVRDPEIQKVRVGDIPERENTIYTYDGNFDKLIELILTRRSNDERN
ncbi:MAG: molybdopterin-guanine dinucleotide biosynthesis protein B [Anaerolineaceae bacterium]|nr:molybdopterin-guanine dinucleotide biosynthesis protein B [Anaerolineaceae bacterium]